MKYTAVYWRTVYVALPSKLGSDQQSKESYLLFELTVPQHSPYYQWNPCNLVGAQPHPFVVIVLQPIAKVSII